MRPLLHPDEMGVADRATIDSGTPAEMLMERAGRAVLRAVVACAGGRYGRRVVVICGKGNNGGDGFVVARLARREGFGVACLLLVPPDEIKGAAARHLAAMQRSGVEARPFESRDLDGADVLVDAIFGTGFRGRAEGVTEQAIHAINERADSASVIAVDIPSGVDGATGAVRGPAVAADLTVAMAAEKIGTAMSPGAALAGRVEVADIGILLPDTTVRRAETVDVARLLPARPPDAHKRSSGSVVIIGGSSGMSGAVVLSARAAVRAGAGYATAGVTAAVQNVVSIAVPEVLTAVADDNDVLGPGVLDKLSSVIERTDALAIGPGLGRGSAQADLVARVLEEVELPVVLDADGLNVLEGRLQTLIQRAAPTVITPHPAELARLLETTTDEVQSDRLRSARTAVDMFDCVVVLKGFRSLIAGSDDGVVVNPTGGPELATAGTGDVLTGIIAALLAGGIESFNAAWAGAFIHGLAGSAAASGRGTSGVLAGDVAESIPAAILELRSGRAG